jgi:hypothetical protein
MELVPEFTPLTLIFPRFPEILRENREGAMMFS